MALLLKKKHIINSLGEEQELNIYTTKTEAVDDGKPCKVIQVEVDGEMITGYIGCTDELDTKKASSKRVMVDGVEYAERKYMGIKDMTNYMANTYPDTYKTLTEITEDMLPDTSDAINFNSVFKNCNGAESIPYLNTSKGTNFASFYEYCWSTKNLPKVDTKNGTNFSRMFADTESHPIIDTGNGTNFSQMYFRCTKVKSFPLIDTSKGTNFSGMYIGCSSATTFPLIDTSSGTTTERMYEKCSSAIELPSLNTSKSTNFISMYAGCSKCTEFPNIDTSLGKTFKWMYSGCSNAIKVSEIDLSQAQDSQLTGVEVLNMFEFCSSLRSITFNNLPIGTTEETLRSKCGIPDTVTEIIMNYRSE